MRWMVLSHRYGRGRSGTGNVYEGHYKSRTFETAYLEYGIMQLQLVKGTDKEVWFLQDPVEDNPEHGWEEYADRIQKDPDSSFILAGCGSLRGVSVAKQGV